MSLSFQTEHLAWQQRVAHEVAKFPESRHTETQVPFPKIKQTDHETNYRSGSFNLAFAFGGTRNIQQVHKKTDDGKQEKHKKYEEHVKKLKNQIWQERNRRIQAEKQKKS